MALKHLLLASFGLLAELRGDVSLAFLLLLVGFSAHDDGNVGHLQHFIRGVLLEDLAEVFLPMGVVNQNVDISRALPSRGFGGPKLLIVPH